MASYVEKKSMRGVQGKFAKDGSLIDLTVVFTKDLWDKESNQQVVCLGNAVVSVWGSLTNSEQAVISALAAKLRQLVEV